MPGPLHGGGLTQLFNRDVRVIAGPVTIDARTAAGERQPLLKLTFDVTKNLDREANKCSLAIWNLKETNRKALQEKGLEVIIEAGYVDERNQIFKGDLEQAVIRKETVDWIVEVDFGDGSKQLKTARINESLRGPQSVGSILQKVTDALGLDPGNLKEKVQSDGARSVLKELLQNVVLSGKAADVLDEIASSAGLRYSVQDKTLQFLGKGEAIRGSSIPLNESKGLLGSPEIGEEGVVTARSLLNGRIKPGTTVNLESVLLRGDYIVQQVRHIGDTWGDQWETQIEMKAT